MKSGPAFNIILLLLLIAATSCEPLTFLLNDSRAPVLSPEHALKSFKIAPGLRIELVAAEPMVEAPVAMTFDEAGRLWVVEMRGFMPDIEGLGEDEPSGRVVVLEDLNKDGQMDQRTVFLDSLILPRAIALVNGGILIAEQQPLWYVEDLDNDLVPDKKTLVDPEYGAGGLPEHAPNGLWRGLDNWIYNVKSTYRYKQTSTGWVKDSTEFRGQWGLSHDDFGRLFYNYNWSQLHADLVPPNFLMRNPHHVPSSGIDHGLTTDMRVFPVRSNYAVNRGYTPGALDEQGRILEFTSASAPHVYRGHALPEEFKGDVFVCEPAGNLIKRNTILEEGLVLTSTFAYPDAEFLASTDERFRPVNLASGPDGALYIADMYRGIIQHGAYMTPYLKEKIIERELDQDIHRGRIWRIVSSEKDTPFPVDLSSASDQELISYLSHENGWYRDTAQRLLISRNASADLVSSGFLEKNTALGRLHALWTLDGLGLSDPEILLNALTDPSDQVRSTALRILYPKVSRDPDLKTELGRHFITNRPLSKQETLHRTFVAEALDHPNSISYLVSILNEHAEDPVMRDAVLSSSYSKELDILVELSNDSQWQHPDPSRMIALEMIVGAISSSGQTHQIEELKQSTWPETWAPIIANGLMLVVSDSTRGSNESVLTDSEKEQFARGRQLYLTGCAGCHGNEGNGLPRFAPPLTDSEWVLGDERRLIRILLHGMEGPVEVSGKMYGPPDILPVMPPHSVLDDAEIASILTYIRNAWGHNAGSVPRSEVGRIRHGNQGKTLPWTPEELLKIPVEAL